MVGAVEPLRDDVWRLSIGPRDAINVYLVGDVLVDAGLKATSRRLLAGLAGRTIAAHALTHAHPDHVGGSKAVLDAFGVELWAPRGEAAAVAAGHPPPPPAASRLAELLARTGTWPVVPVGRELAEGDDLGRGFTVLEVPGHAPGHAAFWRAADRTLICGDVLFNLRLPTLEPALGEPPALLTGDVAQNQASIRRLAALEPDLVLFGHGPPLRDAARRLAKLAAAL